MPKQYLRTSEQDYSNDIQDTCLQRWEDEGGADHGYVDRSDWRDSLGPAHYPFTST